MEKVIKDILKHIEKIRNRIEEHVESETRARALRYRCDWYEHGETSSKCFLNLKKMQGRTEEHQKTGNRCQGSNNRQKRNIKGRTPLLQKNSTPVQDAKTKVKTWSRYGSDCPKGDEESHNDMTLEITEEKVWKMVKDRPKIKSLGINGFTTVFYLEMWPHVKKIHGECLQGSPRNRIFL